MTFKINEQFLAKIKAQLDAMPKYCVDCENHERAGGPDYCKIITGPPDLVTKAAPFKRYHCTDQRLAKNMNIKDAENFCGIEGKLYSPKQPLTVYTE